MTKVRQYHYLYENCALIVVIFPIEVRKSILPKRRLAHVAQETMEPVEWKILFAVDTLKYEAFIL